eukprot:gene25340-10999_t
MQALLGAALSANARFSLAGCSMRSGLRLFSTGASEETVDVAIVGGGMVGGLLASLLSKNPLTEDLKVLLIDQKAQSMDVQPNPFPDLRAQAMDIQPNLFPDLRVSTVTPASIRAMKAAGAWDEIESHARFFSDMQVWDTADQGHIQWNAVDVWDTAGQGHIRWNAVDVGLEHMGCVVWDTAGQGHIRWNAVDVGLEHMGCVVENSIIQAAFLRASQHQAPASSRTESNVEISWPASISQLTLPYSADLAGTSSGSRHESGSSLAKLTFQVWDTADQGHIQWNAVDVASEHMGLVVTQQAKATIRWNASGRGLEPHGLCGDTAGQATSGMEAVDVGSAMGRVDGRVVNARLVVAADGANSKVRQMAGLRTYGWEYNQRAVVATVQTEGMNTTAWQRFLPSGPLALLPVRDGFSSIVWTTTPEAAKKLEAMSPQEFAQAMGLGQAGSAAASALSQAGTMAAAALGQAGSEVDSFQSPPHVEAWVGPPPRSFPLQLKHSGRYIAPRVALIGDAAHSVHPLAGQGVNLGFGDATELASAIAAARQCGADIGDATFLKETYERPRQFSNTTMMMALDVVKSTFKAQAPGFGALRNVGMGVINMTGPMKNQLMKAAMGI